jgi:hypothetical protein
MTKNAKKEKQKKIPKRFRSAFRAFTAVSRQNLAD